MQHGAALFLHMAAPHEPALAQIGGKLREGLRQAGLQLQIQLLRVEGGEARCVDNVGILVQREHLHMTGGVAATAQGLADLPHRQAEHRLHGVEDAGLAHAGVAGEGVQLSLHGPAQLRQALSGGGTDPQHRNGGGSVTVV